MKAVRPGIQIRVSQGHLKRWIEEDGAIKVVPEP
jgi:hypothetical protein